VDSNRWASTTSIQVSQELQFTQQLLYRAVAVMRNPDYPVTTTIDKVFEPLQVKHLVESTPNLVLPYFKMSHLLPSLNQLMLDVLIEYAVNDLTETVTDRHKWSRKVFKVYKSLKQAEAAAQVEDGWSMRLLRVVVVLFNLRKGKSAEEIRQEM